MKVQQVSISRGHCRKLLNLIVYGNCLVKAEPIYYSFLNWDVKYVENDVRKLINYKDTCLFY